MTRPPPRSTLFPYTTLFRSNDSSTLTEVKYSGPTLEISTKTNSHKTMQHQIAPSLLAADFSNLAGEVAMIRSEEHTSELQSRPHLVCRLLLEKKKKIKNERT